ncbi:Sphingomyelin synthetase [Trichostrongylus colubriformis]|uniref:Sphingomyelin synthetase n=1 Tax=Trichostrongylus colubriformis TaxID=6319 RepID=A0AAN8F5Y7_TRICO
MVRKATCSPLVANGGSDTVMPSEVYEWTTKDVSIWLQNAGFQQYADLFANQHKIDGATLMMLSELDLRDPPLQIKCLGDIKRLGRAIYDLRNSHFNSSQPSPRNSESASQHDDVLLCVEYDQRRKMSISGEDVFVRTKQSAIIDGPLVETLSEAGDIRSVRLISRDELIRTVESPDTKAKSLAKLVIAFFYCLSSLLITAFVMVLVHDRVPDMKMYPPLPDIVLDNVPLIPWAFEVCELIGVALCFIWFTVLAFHKHRVVIMRRMFSLVGTVFLLRCITMLITSLSVPGVHLECQAKSYGSLMEKLTQAFHIWSRLGMSIRGVRTCGDYMFSGHTTAITLLNHFITEYTPSSWTFLHTATWVMNLFGVFFILAGHEHYSIDVFIAFYISSRMFLYYHAYAYNHANLTATDDRIRLWFPLGWFFEAGSIGKVPNEFEMPLRVIVPRWWNSACNYDEKEKREEQKHEKEVKHSKKLKKKSH